MLLFLLVIKLNVGPLMRDAARAAVSLARRAARSERREEP